MPPAISPYDQLESLLLSPVGEKIRSLDVNISEAGPGDIDLIIGSYSSQITYIGNLLVNTDREFRRAAAILEPRDPSVPYYLGRRYDRPRPIPPSQGGLQVEEAESGSLYLLAKAYGAVLALLASRPVAAFATVTTLGQGIGSVIRVWPRRHRDALNGISARQLLEIIKELGGNPAELLGDQAEALRVEQAASGEAAELAEEGDHDLRRIGAAPVGSSQNDWLNSVPLQDVPAQSLITSEDPDTFYESEDVSRRGRTIIYVRTYRDGSSEVIYIKD